MHQVLGTLTVCNTRDEPQLTEENLNLVKMLADQAAVAVKNAWLYSEQQQRSDELGELLQMARELSTILGARERLKFIARKTALICGADRCSIILLDEIK